MALSYLVAYLRRDREKKREELDRTMPDSSLENGAGGVQSGYESMGSVPISLGYVPDLRRSDIGTGVH